MKKITIVLEIEPDAQHDAQWAIDRANVAAFRIARELNERMPTTMNVLEPTVVEQDTSRNIQRTTVRPEGPGGLTSVGIMKSVSDGIHPAPVGSGLPHPFKGVLIHEGNFPREPEPHPPITVKVGDMLYCPNHPDELCQCTSVFPEGQTWSMTTSCPQCG